MSPLMAFAAVLLFPQWFDRAPLQPYEVRSASGEWTFEVRPSHPHGEGPMHACILQGGEARWSGDFPWTFEQAGVSDDGTCVGYANGDKLRIAVVDSQGALRKLHEIEHTASVMHGPDLPSASGPVLVHPTADLALIRVLPTDLNNKPVWRAFRLSTGEASADVVPEQPLQLPQDQDVYERDARVIGDTELTLLHWWFADYEPANLDWPQEGGVFALHDLQGKAVWTLALLDDYTDRTSEEADDRLENEVSRTGVIVSAGPGNRFALRHVREKAQVEYAVEKDEGRWSVKEVSRIPWSTDGAVVLAVEPIELVRKAAVPLRQGAPPPRHPIHGVMQLGFTEQGELELLRREEAGGPSYARLRTDGELLFERDLPSLEREGAWPQFHELSGDRWLAQFLSGEPYWMELDVSTGNATPAPLPEAGLGSHVAPLADGGYLALLSRIVRSLAFTELYRVGADGTIAWQHAVTGMGPDDTDFDRAVYFGRGIARTGEKTFTLLSMEALSRIDLERNVLDTWKLEELLGHDAGYTDGLLSDGKGGVLFESGDAFQRVDSYGTRTGSLVPRRSDGSRDGIMDHLLRVAPDGRFWTSDRQRLYRLDEAGVTDMVLGPEVKDDELAAVDHAVLDVLGRALLQDNASRSVHVFDADGRRLAIIRLAPAERPDGYVGDPFGGDRDASIWVKVQEGTARFDASGARVDGAEPKLGKRPRTEEEAERKTLNEIKVRPDGNWLSSARERAVLPDGRRVILEWPEEQGENASLHFYTAAGEPLHTVAIPSGTGLYQLSPGARWIAVGGYGPSWTLLRLADERVFRFEPDLQDASNWHIGQTPDGKTLLLLNGRRLELVRYELP